jgi:hypothetical protein
MTNDNHELYNARKRTDRQAEIEFTNAVSERSVR